MGKCQVLKHDKKTRDHFFFYLKYDGRHKDMLVADGCLIDFLLSSVSSGILSLRGIRLVIFLAEINFLESWGTEIGNSFLEASIKEKVCVVARPELGPLEGHNLIIVKYLYGLRTSCLL